MHDLFEKFREALSHSIVDALVGHSIAETIGGFAGTVAAFLAATSIIALIGVAGGWFAWFELPGRIKAWTIRRGNPNRLNVLLARFEGVGGLDVKDGIKEQLDGVFTEISDRPFEIINFPLTMRVRQAGNEKEIQDRTVRKARRWLRRARGDLLIWGRAHEAAEHATIFFVFPRDFDKSKGKTGSDDRTAKSGGTTLVPERGTRVYDFRESPRKFSADAAAAIAFAAAMSVRPIFAAETVSRLKPEVALSLIHKLEPFLGAQFTTIPVNLSSEIRTAYTSASQGLGRQGVVEGWRLAIRLQNEDQKKINKITDPERWADSADKLAATLREAGEQFGINEWLEQAVILYRELLDLYTRERSPLDWAATQNKLGYTLQRLGKWERGTQRFEEAITAYRDALKERTREKVPLLWAATQDNLGTALGELGERVIGTTRIEEAIAAHRSALEERTREQAPLDWAMTQTNLGTALVAFGAREWDASRLEEGVIAYRHALSVCPKSC